MASTLAEPLIKQLEDECKNIDWRNITAAQIPWKLFPSLSSGQKASELVVQGRAILSIFQKHWEENTNETNRSAPTETRKKPRRVGFAGIKRLEYPLDYLAENCHICILLNTLGKPEAIDQITTLRTGLPLTRDDLAAFIHDENIRARFLEDQKNFLCNIDPDLEITFIHTDEFPPFRVIKVLGSEASSVVEEVRNVMTNKALARKLFRMGSRRELSSVRRFLRELEHLKKLIGSRHVVQLTGCYQWRSELGMLLEPAADCDLRKYLERFSSSTQFQRQAMENVLGRMFGCLCITLDSICETNSMRHKDIKPENILVHKKDVLFTDFGSAMAFWDTRGTTSGTNVGAVTDMYCAPEVLVKQPRDITADVFSLGCVYLEIIAALVREDGSLWRSFKAPYGRELDKVRKLLDDLKAESKEWRSPLHWCSRMLEEREKRPTISELIEEIIRTPGTDLSHFFCHDCLRELMHTALKMLDTINQEEPTAPTPSEIKKDRDTDSQEQDGEIPLRMATVIEGIDALNVRGNTVLHLAAQTGKVAELRKLLLEDEASVDAQNDDGNTALHLAAQAGQVAALQELVGKGADFNVGNHEGNTALHLAAQAGEVAALLELEGADINARNNEGNTALHLAVQARKVAVARKLVEVGADIISVENEEEETALDVVLGIIQAA